MANLKRALRDHPGISFDLTVEGGLPVMPGHESVTMPPRKLTVAAERDRGSPGDDTNGSEP